MLLQAFLSYNNTFRIIESIPFLRQFDEDFLINNLASYRSIAEYNQANVSRIGYPPCSIWIEKVK